MSLLNMEPSKTNLPTMNYYDIPDYASNSDLGELDRLLNGGHEFGGDKKTIFAFGNLVDALISEPELVNHENQTVKDAHGEVLTFTQVEWDKAQRMRKAALDHPFVKLLVGCMEFQVVAINPKFEIDCEYAKFTIPARGKADGIAKAIKTGMDLKTTACTNLKAFIDSLMLFDYDRQSAWYMDLFGLDRFIFVGIGKTQNRKGQHEIFIHAVERGDEMYKSGLAKYQKLAFMYKTFSRRNAVDPPRILNNVSPLSECATSPSTGYSILPF